MTKRSQQNDASVRGSGSAQVGFNQKDKGELIVLLSGSWCIGDKVPSNEELHKRIETKPQVPTIVFDLTQLKDWDSSLLTFLISD